MPQQRGLAPQPLALIQEFVNTLDIEEGTDAIATADQLTDWLARHGSHSTRPLTAGDLSRMTDIREGLRELLGVHTGSDADTDTVGRMNAALSGAEVVLRIGPERTRLEGREGVDHVIARIGQAVMTAQADGSWERLKVCRNDDCRWAFFDASRNRSGVWCDMGLCGSQAKVRAYRQRRSAGG